MSARDTVIRGPRGTSPDPPRRRRWPVVLAIIAGLLLIVILVIAHYLQPAQLTALVLDRASRALKLDLHTSGPGSYAWRPEPRLVLPGLSASVPGSVAPFFRSGQVELALPWSTLRGGDPVITRIVLKSPDLDLTALQHWLATRPPRTTPFKLPRLTKGLGIEDGLLRGDGWRIEHFDVALPMLTDGKPTTLDASGNLLRGVMASKFKLTLAATPTGQGRGLRIEHARIALKADGELPSLTADGSMVSTDAFALDLAGILQSLPAGWAASIDSSYVHGDTPFAIALNATLPSPKPATNAMQNPAPPENVQLRKFTLGDPSRQPVLTLAGAVATQTVPDGPALDAALRGQFSRWPNAWPALPEVLAATPAPLIFDAAYRGPKDFSAPIAYNAKRADSELHGQFRIADIKSWIASKFAALLPPIAAQLSTPRIDIAGMQLQGVRMEIRDDVAPPAATSKPTPALNSGAGKSSGTVPRL